MTKSLEEKAAEISKSLEAARIANPEQAPLIDKTRMALTERQSNMRMIPVYLTNSAGPERIISMQKQLDDIVATANKLPSKKVE